MNSHEQDLFYGYEINSIERHLYETAKALRPEGTLDNLSLVLHSGHQTWIGLDPQTLNTPYSELRQICGLLSPGVGELVLDLGAGYGRLGLIMKELCPETHFLGFEIVSERVTEGNRVLALHSCENAKLEEQDLSSEDFQVPEADYYFIYDFGRTSQIRRTLKQLEQLADKKSFKLVARGKGTRSIIDLEHPWLSFNPVHREDNFAIYSY